MQSSERSYSCRLFRYCGNDMSDTNSSAVSVWDGLNFVMWYFILPAVYIGGNALRSKAVAFTWHCELKQWHKAGSIPASKYSKFLTQRIECDSQNWIQSNRHHFSVVLCPFVHVPFEIVSIFPSSWLRGALNAVQSSAAAAHLFFMCSFTCVFRDGPLHTWTVRSTLNWVWITLLWCWGQSGDSPLTSGINAAVSKRESQIAGYFLFSPTGLSETHRNPDLQLVKSWEQLVWRNNHATLTVNPLFSSVSTKCF